VKPTDWFDPSQYPSKFETRATRPSRTRAEREAEAARGKANERFIAAQLADWATEKSGVPVVYQENPDPFAPIDGWLFWKGHRCRLLEAKARTPMRVPDGFYRVEVPKMTALQRGSLKQGIPALLAFGFEARIEVLRVDATSEAWVSQLRRVKFSEGDEAYLVPFDAWTTIEREGWVTDPNPHAYSSPP
jgi:hypothetical protein